MKKLFFSTALFASAVFGLLAEEGDGYRRTWDFTKGWSETTIAKLEADASNWEAQTTGFQNNPTAMTANATPWVTVDGEKEPIAELDGMTINSSLAKAKHCQICTTGSGLSGVPCFWLNGKGDAVSVKVPAGENVRFGYTAHGAQDRGFKCSTGFADENGATQFTNADNQQIHEVLLINSNAGESTLTLTTVNGGSHIYYVIIGDGDTDEETMTEDPNIAYVYSGNSDIDSDPLRQFVGFDDYCTVTNVTIESLLDGTVSQDSIESFDVVVLAPSAFSDESSAYINARLNRVPILNFTPSAILGYTKVDPALTSFTVGEDYADADLFLDMEYSGDNEIAIFSEGVLSDNMVYGYTLAEGSDFADDEVYATAGEYSAIHIHGKKNAYMLIPFAVENILANDDYAITDNTTALISNAVKYLRTTKATVTTAMKPTVAYTYEDGVTTATLKSTLTGAKIFYTIDGTEPTAASTRYTEPIVFTSAATLKAFVVAPAYNNSDVLTDEVIIKTQLPTPRISIAQVEGSSTITLSTSAEAGIYYSFNGQTSYDRATLYAEPIVITEPGTISAFAYADGFLTSELAVADVQVGGIPAVTDTLAHFDAGTTDWFDNAILHGADGSVLDTPTENWTAKAAYYFGKSAWEYYSTEVDRVETVYGEDGKTPLKSQIEGQTDLDSTITYYKPDASAVRSIKSATDTKWVIKTQGQQLTGETDIAQFGYVKYEGASAARYHDEAIDLIGGPATTGCLTLGGKVSGNPFTASIQTVEKYAAPFDVVVYANQGNSDGATVNVEIQVSADGETWTAIGDVKFAYTQRHIKKTRVHYSEAGEVYVRLAQVGGSTKAQICDIYVIRTEGTTGIDAITANDEKSAKSQYVIDLMGRRAGAMVSGQMYLKDGKIVLMK